MEDITRRRALGLGLGGLATTALAACGAPGMQAGQIQPVLPPAEGPVSLTYWAWLKDLQNVCDIWNSQNPNIQVQAEFMEPGNDGGYAKQRAASDAGGGPDIGQIEFRSVPDFVLGGALANLAPYGARDLASRYDRTTWEQVNINEGIYAIPQDSGPMGWFYQTAPLEEIGAAPPVTWEEWEAVAREARNLSPDTYLEVFNVADASFFVSMAIQAGAQWFSTEGDEWVMNFTDEPTLRVAEFWDRMIDDDLVNTGYGAFSPGWYAAAGEQKILSVTTGSWGDALVQSTSGGAGNWKVAPMASWPDMGYGSSQLGGSTAAIFANSQHPREALEFVTWMTSTPEGIDAMIKNSGIGWSVSPDYIGETRQAPSEFFSGQNYNEEVFVSASQDQNLDWNWAPMTERIFLILSDGFRTKLTAGTSFVDSLAEAQRRTVDAFRNVGLSVRAGG
ncbi:extracellular solute-binding protein [Arthrobacter sp. H5]|uniref:ABC transporter substrate-binding protein n=1 Tax=Arthrobacter sp. H5 TaxID=1267973 RepID=UPI00047FEE6D|nr:extracellular solute-binding protein [Arthrobacter sp. H5]